MFFQQQAENCHILLIQEYRDIDETNGAITNLVNELNENNYGDKEFAFVSSERLGARNPEQYVFVYRFVMNLA